MLSSRTAWICLVAAGLLEIGWAVGLKYTNGFTRPLPTAATLAALGGSVVLLGIAVRVLPIGTAYAVWTGIGAAGTVAFGMAFLGDPRDSWRIGCLCLILAGVIGLKLR